LSEFFSRITSTFAERTAKRGKGGNVVKSCFKGFVFGIIVSTLLTGVAYAGGISKTINAVFNSVNIAVNGQRVSADNILYKGTTYVPLRAVADMLGKDVVWDNSTNTANINDRGIGPSASSEVKTTGYSRTNPAPIGTLQRITVDSYIENYTAEVVVKDTVRGEAAWKKIKAANMFNQEPGANEEYILAKIWVKAVEVKDGKQLSVSEVSFDLYSEGNTKYNNNYSVVEPDPSIRTDLYSGAEHEGYVVFKVKKTDNNPKIAFGLKYDGTGGIWFALQ